MVTHPNLSASWKNAILIINEGNSLILLLRITYFAHVTQANDLRCKHKRSLKVNSVFLH
jgi:hypothetical protein